MSSSPHHKYVTEQQYREAHRAYLFYAWRYAEALGEVHPHLEFVIDPVVALNVTVATYDDIDRYKAYHLRNHGGERSNAVKRASYFAKWTTKLRPIMLSRPTLEFPDPDMGLMVNESLGISWMLDLLSDEESCDLKLSSKSHADLLYDLHYRDIGDDALMSIVQMVADLAEARQANPIVEFSLD